MKKFLGNLGFYVSIMVGSIVSYELISMLCDSYFLKNPYTISNVGSLLLITGVGALFVGLVIVSGIIAALIIQSFSKIFSKRTEKE